MKLQRSPSSSKSDPFLLTSSCWPNADSTSHLTHVKYCSSFGLSLATVSPPDVLTGCCNRWVQSLRLVHLQLQKLLLSSWRFLLIKSQTSIRSKLNTNWDWYGRLLSNPQVFLNNLPLAIILFKKIGNKRGKENHVTTQEGFMTNRSFKCSPYLWTNTADAQKITKKKRQSNMHAYAMQYEKGKASCLSSLIHG